MKWAQAIAVLSKNIIANIFLTFTKPYPRKCSCANLTKEVHITENFVSVYSDISPDIASKMYDEDFQ